MEQKIPTNEEMEKEEAVEFPSFSTPFPLELFPWLESGQIAQEGEEKEGPQEEKEELDPYQKYRRVCSFCSKNHKKCSGPPGPCNRCTTREIQNECMFEKKKTPGRIPHFHKEAPLLSQSVPDEIGVQIVISRLTHLGFLAPNSTRSALLNQAYVSECILSAILFWKTYSHTRSTISKNRFIASMIQFQKKACNFQLSENGLHQLWWLTGADHCPEDLVMEEKRCLILEQVALLFMWLGPAEAKNVMPAEEAVSTIYNYIRASKDRERDFLGFSSKEANCFKLQFRNHGDHPVIYCLNEGRAEIVSWDVAGISRETNIYYVRNLVRSRYPEHILEMIKSQEHAGNIGQDEFEHDLLLPVHQSYDEGPPFTSEQVNLTTKLQYNRFNFITESD